MAIESIAALGSTAAGSRLAAEQIASDVARPTSAIAVPRAADDFLAVVQGGVARVDVSLQAADAKLRGLAAGDPIPLHDVMIAMEQARIDLTLIAEVRNRIVEGYQELIRMQL
jgi:flagellar hook-basal body complex protein FliE